jgi:hypothetical protein
MTVTVAALVVDMMCRFTSDDEVLGRGAFVTYFDQFLVDAQDFTSLFVALMFCSSLPLLPMKLQVYSTPIFHSHVFTCIFPPCVLLFLPPSRAHAAAVACRCLCGRCCRIPPKQRFVSRRPCFRSFSLPITCLPVQFADHKEKCKTALLVCALVTPSVQVINASEGRRSTRCSSDVGSKCVLQVRERMRSGV